MNFLVLTMLFVFVFTANIIALCFFTLADIDAPISILKYLIAILIPISLLGGVGRGNFLTSNKYFFLYLLIASFLTIRSLFISDFNASNFIQNIQFIFVIPLSYYIGVSLNSYAGVMPEKLILRISILVGITAALFGFLMLIFHDSIWGSFNLQDYYVVVMGSDDPIIEPYDLPRSWVAWDLANYNDGVPFIRMVSYFAEPVGFGRFMGLCVIFLALPMAEYLGNYRYVLMLLFFLCVIYSLSKGALIVAALWLLCRQVGPKFTMVAAFLFGLMIFYILSLGYGDLLSSSVVSHFSSVFVGVNSLFSEPFGFGINVNDALLAWDLGVGENDFLHSRSEGAFALFSIFYGIPGLICYFLLFVACYPRTSYQEDVMLRGVSALCFAIMLSSVFSHSAFSLVGSGLAFMLLGCLESKNQGYITYAE